MRITFKSSRLGTLAGAYLLVLSSCLSAGELELIQKSTVDEEALTFAVGPAARFSSAVNGRTHQQSPITTYRGYQYVTYFDAERRVCIGRRKLPDSSWETIQFKDHHFKTNDSHNSAVLGICDKDGTIHMAFDHHATRLNYRVSKIGAAHNPDSVEWNSELFGPVQHSLGSVETHERVTYPRFVSAPNGNLIFYYRSVTSADGDGMIEVYDGETHDWTPGLGKFIARDIGTFTANGEESLYRCPYLNSISYAGERLHVSWIWRDRFERTSARNNHSLCYACSDDHGRTWHNSAGELIGETGKTFIHLNSPGLVVSEIPVNSRLFNQNTHYAYPDGSIHIVMGHRPGRGKRSTYHHHWRTSEGVWNHETLGFIGSRPKLVGTEDRSLILVYTDSREQIQIAMGTPASDQASWQWSNLEVSPHSCYGDAVLDLERWEAEQVLSLYSQEEPAKMLRTKESGPVDGMPSPLKVIDYRISTKPLSSR
jgi:hypothetical protein